VPQRIAAVTLIVPDYDDGIAYFCGLLGFELVEDTPLGGWQAVGHRAGVRFLEPPRTERYGTVAVFEDVFGNRWDLLEPA
jgi:catechol 2,3-dioxygenase-like lactoylglutathione lyase family enzyme